MLQYASLTPSHRLVGDWSHLQGFDSTLASSSQRVPTLAGALIPPGDSEAVCSTIENIPTITFYSLVFGVCDLTLFTIYNLV